MLWIFQTSLSSFQINISLLFLRLGSGAMMLTHGWPKLQRLLAGGEITFADPLGVGPVVSLVLAVIAEVLGSLMIMIGFATRIAAVLLVFTMAVAAFIVHADDPFSGKEMALLYLLIFVVLLITGSGRYGIDRYFGK